METPVQAVFPHKAKPFQKCLGKLLETHLLMHIAHIAHIAFKTCLFSSSDIGNGRSDLFILRNRPSKQEPFHKPLEKGRIRDDGWKENLPANIMTFWGKHPL